MQKSKNISKALFASLILSTAVAACSAEGDLEEDGNTQNDTTDNQSDGDKHLFAAVAPVVAESFITSFSDSKKVSEEEVQFVTFKAMLDASPVNGASLTWTPKAKVFLGMTRLNPKVYFLIERIDVVAREEATVTELSGAGYTATLADGTSFRITPTQATPLFVSSARYPKIAKIVNAFGVNYTKNNSHEVASWSFVNEKLPFSIYGAMNVPVHVDNSGSWKGVSKDLTLGGFDFTCEIKQGTTTEKCYIHAQNEGYVSVTAQKVVNQAAITGADAITAYNLFAGTSDTKTISLTNGSLTCRKSTASCVAQWSQPRVEIMQNF